jgi:CTP:molybdopterin cytidylyltransferase MocA
MNVGVLLAAGASTRMGRPKALATWKGQSFLVHGVRALWSACDVVVAVLGAKAAVVRRGAEEEFGRLVEAGVLSGDLHAASRHGARSLEVRFETNRAWSRGMLSSVRVGVAAALKARPSAVLVMPVDHPEVRGDTVGQLAAMMSHALKSFSGNGGRQFPYALVPRCSGRRGHPLAMSAALARAVARDADASDLGDSVRRHARLVGYLDVRDRGILVNRNTPAAGGGR